VGVLMAFLLSSLIALTITIEIPMYYASGFINQACSLPWVKCTANVSTQEKIEDLMDSFINLVSRGKRSSFSDLGGKVEVIP